MLGIITSLTISSGTYRYLVGVSIWLSSIVRRVSIESTSLSLWDVVTSVMTSGKSTSLTITRYLYSYLRIVYALLSISRCEYRYLVIVRKRGGHNRWRCVDGPETMSTIVQTCSTWSWKVIPPIHHPWICEENSPCSRWSTTTYISTYRPSLFSSQQPVWYIYTSSLWTPLSIHGWFSHNS
jgi:hypothetical protein